MDRCYTNTRPTRHARLPVVLTEREVVNIKQKLMKQKTLVHWIQLSGARFLYNATTVFIPYKFGKTLRRHTAAENDLAYNNSKLQFSLKF